MTVKEKMLERKPFLRWAGSKRKLIPKLIQYWDKGSTRYIEPFMGSAALFFAINPAKAILSDINLELVETFKAVRDHPQAVYNRLSHLPLGKDSYYEIRQKDASCLKPFDQAARFIFLNRFCFNGLYRTNMKGQFNVPYASSKTGRLPSLLQLKYISNILSKIEIINCDFEDTLAEVKHGDFVYMDPPYAVQNRRIFRQYGPDCFGLNDLERLSSALPKIDQIGATFLVSYAMCREAINAFKGWNIRRAKTQRSVAGFSANRRKAVEILVSNKTL